MKSIIYTSTTELIGKIKEKQISVVEVVTIFLEQIEEYNPIVNAIFDLREKSEILKEAKEKDLQIQNGEKLGELHGIPMTIKDSFNVKGLKTSNGNPQFRNYIAKDDAELIKRLKNAGVIILGKTNIPLLCIDWQSTNFWNGQTNNPYDLSRVAGGSSGGSAVSIASGFSALELGADAGGSIRVPAHFCGICGLRPTENALPNRGHLKTPNKPQGHRHITVPGPLAKNIDDLILMMNVLWNNKKYPLAEIPNIDFNSSSWNREKLNIAFSNSINQIEVDKEYLEIIENFLNKIKTENHNLTTDFPKYDERKAYLICGEIIGFEFDTNMPNLPLSKAFIYWFIRLKYKDKLWAKGISKGIRASAKKYAKSLDDKDYITDIYQSFLSKYDLWITPVCAIEAFKHQKAGIPFNVNGKKVKYTEAIASFNFTTALSGHPIVVIPIGKKKNGMPVGIQIHSKKWTDKKLLEIAKYFEKFTNGFEIPKINTVGNNV